MSTTPVLGRAAVDTTPGLIDARGPRFAATLTTLVLAAVLLLAPHRAGLLLLTAQAAAFAVGAAAGVQHTPHAWLYRTLVRPRLGPALELEDARPPRFAQLVGLVFAVLGLTAYLLGVTVVGQAVVGLALVAALLNAAFAFCLGCELYLRVRRLTS